ncbi:isocitrate lyase/PEP mutase family protein [Oceanibacterium hippocampi]|uniref:2,3-dimethylmalate lyase n=1 Tax=Oceanibacterium hippocampi TaxID=745714 RepID=A0A1Y5S898_9PROT|nr:isocitrate lyase/phosphoenolpyruvate mutase family protein [Oceanibacterium hippocampi]SLN33408.1 2,3-dimethylmalate lyase [Oceanibacterium hippocampi]
MPGDIAEKGARFRALHERGGAFVMPNPWDLGTTRILDGLGFDALATTSAGLAYSLGRRDGEGAVSRDEALAHAALIAAATELPVNADLENGFADDPAGVAETIRRAGETGIVGCSIEDATGDRQRPIYDFGLAVERIAAAAEAARALPFAFTLTARSENFLHGRRDLEDTIARLKAFEEAGADVLYAPALPDIDALAELCQAVGKPVNFLMGSARTPLSAADVSAVGVRRISIGSGLFNVAFGSFLKAAKGLHEDGLLARDKSLPTGRDIAAFMADGG